MDRTVHYDEILHSEGRRLEAEFAGLGSGAQGLTQAALMLDCAGCGASVGRIIKDVCDLSLKSHEYFDMRPGISVIVVVSGNLHTLATTLDDLRAQTLPTDQLQIIVVSSTKIVLRDPAVSVYQTDSVNVLQMHLDGLHAAERRFACVMQAGDRVKPAYLNSILRLMQPGHYGLHALLIPAGGVHGDETVDEAGGKNSAATLQGVRRLQALGVFHVWPDMLTLADIIGAKFIFPTVLRGHMTVPALSVGADINQYKNSVGDTGVSPQTCKLVFWAHALIGSGLVVRLPNMQSPDAALFSHNAGVLLAAPETLDEILAAIVAIESGISDSARASELFADMLAPIAAQVMAGALDWDVVIVKCRSSPVTWDVVGYLARHTARTLVVSYCFAPNADTAGNVMAKRLPYLGGAVDVVSKDMQHLRPKDASLRALTRDYVGTHHIIPGTPGFGDAAAVIDFAQRTAEIMGEQAHRYTQIYSRAMWPASHFAAALVKLRHPHMRWTAEFSDPLALDINGAARRKRMSIRWLKRTGLWQTTYASLLGAKIGKGLFTWAEALPYAMADVLLFTNENQKHYMLNQRWIGARRSTLEARARVSSHPTSPARFYDMPSLLAAAQPVDDTRVTIGYFGKFYGTRGAGQMLQAIAALPDQMRAQILLYVYCPDPVAVLRAARAAGVMDQIIYRAPLPYLEFLRTLKTFDYLLVSDMQTAQFTDRNPYLPSKLSDYLGAGTPVWALSEPGSVMAQTPLPPGSHRSLLGDVKSYTHALRAFCAHKRGTLNAN